MASAELDFSAAAAMNTARVWGLRMSNFNKRLSLVADEEDISLHEQNCDEALITERLGELVPLLKFVGFRVEQASPHRTVLTVPLLESAMNQNGTQQAAVFYLLADYTLGVAMFAAMPGIYTVGVHDRCNAMPVQFWLKGGQVTHLAPGTGTIRAVVELVEAVVRDMRQRMVDKGRCVIKGQVKIYQGDKLVAISEHEMGMYADLPRETDVKPSMNQVERMKISALMIAGLRGDDVSSAVAGEQGIAVASRMSKATPQLPSLVQARTQHAREQLKKKTFKQVLVLGAGFDPKPYELASEGQYWFIADLPEMLTEREFRMSALASPMAQVINVPLDLRTSEWLTTILKAGFDPGEPTFVMFEGVSMYLTQSELRDTLKRVQLLCGHPDSRLWLDHVTSNLFSMDDEEVTSFLKSMARLGEPFVTGFDDAVQFGGPDQWVLADSLSAADIAGVECRVHREYRFSTLMPGAVMN